MENKKYIYDYIENNWDKKTKVDIMKELNIGFKRLNKIATDLGIYKKIEIFTVTDDFLEYLKKNYKNKTISEISKEFNCSKSVILKHAKKLGLTKETNLWSKEEDKLLAENFNQIHFSSLVALLERTQNTRSKCAVHKRITDLGIKSDATKDGVYLKTADIEEIMGFSRPKIGSLYLRGKIKYSVFKNKRIVSLKDFKSFLKENQNLWHSTNVDLVVLKSFFSKYSISEKGDSCVIEDWFLEKIKSDRVKPIKSKKEWTVLEEKTILRLHKEGKPIKEISILTNRTYQSVYKKLAEIKRR